jgi:prevent-host-death family protein
MAFRTWQLQTAKNRFSELVKEAQKGAPQLVTKNGKAAAYVVDCETFARHFGSSIPDKKQAILARPHKDVSLHIPRRESDTGRAVEL